MGGGGEGGRDKGELSPQIRRESVEKTDEVRQGKWRRKGRRRGGGSGGEKEQEEEEDEEVRRRKRRLWRKG